MAGRLAAPVSLDDLLLYRMARLNAVAGSMVIRLCEGRFGITRREWRLVALLAEDDGLLSSQLAERAQLDRARTSRAITSLVAKKLLTRVIPPGDRRLARIHLTPRGRALHGELFPLVTRIHHDLLAPLAGPEIDHLDRMITDLQARADDLVAHAELPKADRRRGHPARVA